MHGDARSRAQNAARMRCEMVGSGRAYCMYPQHTFDAERVRARVCSGAARLGCAVCGMGSADLQGRDMTEIGRKLAPLCHQRLDFGSQTLVLVLAGDRDGRKLHRWERRVEVC
jgi:hypothetical protein